MTGWKMSFEREFALQGATAGQFDRAWQVLLLADGGFLVSHRKPAGIELYDAEGTFVRSIGSEGSGPNEFISAGSMVMAHDTLVVGDGRRGRIMLYTLKGRLLNSFFVDIHQEPLLLSIDPKGRLRVRQNIGGRDNERLAWTTFTMKGARVDSLVLPLEVRPKFLESAGENGSNRFRLYLPFQPTLGSAFLKDGSLVYGVSDKYEFVTTRSGRDTAMIFARTGLAAKPFPPELADSTIAEMTRSPSPVPLPAITRKDFPAAFPIWNDIAVDDMGYLWVSLGYWSRRSHYFELFSPDGRFLGPVISRFEYLRGASWNGDRVAITTWDKNRMPVVRTFKIDRRESLASPPVAQPPVEFSWGDTRNVCGLYEAALRFAVPDSSKRLVIADSNSMGVPQFAFHAWSGMGPPKEGSGMPWSDSTIAQMNVANRPRAELPACVRQRAGVTTESYAALAAPFKDREHGWEAFAAAHPGAAGFLVLSRPLWLSEAHDEALVQVVQAWHWLAGGGRVLYLRRVNGVWGVVTSHQYWVS